MDLTFSGFVYIDLEPKKKPPHRIEEKEPESVKSYCSTVSYSHVRTNGEHGGNTP